MSPIEVTGVMHDGGWGLGVGGRGLEEQGREGPLRVI